MANSHAPKVRKKAANKAVVTNNLVKAIIKPAHNNMVKGNTVSLVLKPLVMNNALNRNVSLALRHITNSTRNILKKFAKTVLLVNVETEIETGTEKAEIATEMNLVHLEAKAGKAAMEGDVTIVLAVLNAMNLMNNVHYLTKHQNSHNLTNQHHSTLLKQ